MPNAASILFNCKCLKKVHHAYVVNLKGKRKQITSIFTDKKVAIRLFLFLMKVCGQVPDVGFTNDEFTI